MRIIKCIILFTLIMSSITAGCRKPEPAWPEQKNFILISLDTVRLDRLSLHGNERDVSPGLVRLSEKGLVFDQAVTVTENTLISHASLLTGLFPAAHGTTYLNDGVPLMPCYETIAEDFLSTGVYQTAGFAAHETWLNSKFGIDQGFEVFKTGFRSADIVLKEAEKWLKKRNRKKPFFLFIHLFDPHSEAHGRPYDAPEPFLNRWTKDYEGPYQDWKDISPNGSAFLAAVTNKEIVLSEEDIIHLRDQYDEGLAYTDDAIVRFLENFVNPDNTFIIITSDHGEGFFEHGSMLHSSLYDEIVRVPLVIVPPSPLADLYDIPRRIADQVRIVDLRATLLSMAGLPDPKINQGADLNPWLLGNTAECPAGPAPFYHQALRWKGYKFYREGDKKMLFSLQEDPGENINIYGREELSSLAEEMEEILRDFTQKDERISRDAQKTGEENPLSYSEDELEKLRSLGYF